MAVLTNFLKLLKPEKNDYVDVDKHISENYDKIDAEFSKIDTKFKNYCPISIGSVDVRYDNKNPAELYPSTTWELLSSDKYIKTGNTPLSTGGSNSVNILKKNLPNIKLKNDSVSATIENHYHYIANTNRGGHASLSPNNILMINGNSESTEGIAWYSLSGSESTANIGKTSNSGSGNTGTISSYTEILGSDIPLNIQPAYITLKFWKRLS